MSDSFVPAAEAKKQKRAKPSPNAVGRAILERLDLVTDKHGLAYRYNGRHWEEVTTQVLLSEALKEDGEASSDRRRREILAYLKARTTDPLLEWGRVGDGEIPVANGVLDVLTGELRPHQRHDYLDRVIPWHYRRGAECPTWDQCLIDWFGESEEGGEVIAALQEFFGYICLAHAKYKKAAILLGETNTGKSQVLFAATHLVGKAFTCTLGVDLMDDPERRSVIKGMALNIISELADDVMVADSGFKTMVSTEEAIMISAKFKPTEMIVPTAKHLISTNNLPTINDKTKATFGRLLIVPFERIFAEAEQDRAIPDKLGAEMEGILRWAAEGAKRLVARGGQWPEPRRSRAKLDAYREEENPAVDFLAECFAAEEGALLPLSDVTSHFNEWNRGARKRDNKWVARLLRGAGGQIEKQRIESNRSPVRCLVGLRWLGLPAMRDQGGGAP